MTTQETQKTKIRVMWEKYSFFWQMGVGLVVVLVGILIGAVLFDESYITNLYTEFISIAVTIFVLDLLARHREERRLKAQLIREVSSKDYGISMRAIGELRANGWVEDGSLQGKHLGGTNLQKADLHHADLKQARFGMCQGL